MGSRRVEKGNSYSGVTGEDVEAYEEEGQIEGMTKKSPILSPKPRATRWTPI